MRRTTYLDAERVELRAADGRAVMVDCSVGCTFTGGSFDIDWNGLLVVLSGTEDRYAPSEEDLEVLDAEFTRQAERRMNEWLW